MNLLALFLVLIIDVAIGNDEDEEESGSGIYGDYQSVSGSGMLGDEIMPISAIDNFEKPAYENQNEASDIEKRGKINRADADDGTKTPEKRVLNNAYPLYHWLTAQRPVQYSLPAGKCLEENSLCDIGHDGQCCGHASYCVDYWGVGKCLAFLKPDKYDTLATRINRNNLYKAYYRRLQFAATRNG